MAVIELENISKQYHMGSNIIPVLSGVNLTIEEGEFISIMGPSGSGKSTLMNILGCLDQPTSGSYTLKGNRIDILEDEALSQIRNRDIGFVFQSFNLLQENSGIDNIMLPLLYRGVSKADRRQTALDFAESMGMKDRYTHKPNEMSGGQAQRIAIARALVGKPQIILADEPTGNLDSKTGKEIMEIFEKLHQQGHTIIMVTHDEKLARRAKRIVRIKDGVIESDEVTNEKTSYLENKVLEKETGTGKLTLRDLFSISIKEGLFSHPMRTFLTMLGVLFGVAAVIAIVAINEGARKEALDQIQQMGLNNIRVKSLKMTEQERRDARIKLSSGLGLEDYKAILSIPTIKCAVPIKNINAEVLYKDIKPRSKIIGTLPVYERVANFYAHEGRFLKDDDVKYFKRVCILGATIKEKLFSNEKCLGEKIYIGPEVYTVIGVMQSKNKPRGVAKAVSSNDLNSNIYIPISCAQKRFKQEKFANQYDEISIMVDISDNMHKTANVISRLIMKQHHNVNDFEVVVPEELLRQSRKTQEIFDIVMVCIAGISLLVGGIGIMNIMLATVTERVKEIGIRRAIGASQKDILSQFLVEALTISIMGGVLGILLGWSLTIIISKYLDWQTVVSALSVFIGFGVAAVVGIIFGIYPAWRASLLDPIIALNSN